MKISLGRDEGSRGELLREGHIAHWDVARRSRLQWAAHLNEDMQLVIHSLRVVA